MPEEWNSEWNRQLEATTVTGSEVIPELPVEIPALTILWHPDSARVGERALLSALPAQHREALSRAAPDFTPFEGGRARPLADPYLSRRPLWLQPLVDGVLRLDRSETTTPIRAGAQEVGDSWDLTPEALRQGVTLLLADRVLLLLHSVDPASSPCGSSFGLVGESRAIREVHNDIRRLAPRPLPVLVRGRTGTGKELVARALHDASPRHAGPFVSVNLAALPSSLAAAELFGAEKGSFTGADRRRSGVFRRAHGGTLFLDEIGETPREVQPLLLRALEEGEIQPLGAAQTKTVDVRVVAATDLDLEEAIGEGRFLEPLLYRLAGLEIALPTLASRCEDVPRLLRHFLEEELAGAGAADCLRTRGPRAHPWLPARVVEQLVHHPWPGNVRQLRNVARALVASFSDRRHVARGRELERILGIAAAEDSQRPDPRQAGSPPRRRREHLQPSQVDEPTLRDALRRNRWSLKPTAEVLGISRTSLYALLDKLPGFRTAARLTAEEVESGLDRCAGDVGTLALDLEVSKQGLLQRMRELGLR